MTENDPDRTAGPSAESNGDVASAPDPAVLATARALIDQAIGLISRADGERLLAYLRAGQLAAQAKAMLGHGRWLPFLYEHCQKSEATIRRTMAVAEAVAGDAWLAEHVHANPAAWSVRRVLEYAGLTAAQRREAQERGIYTDFRGTRAAIEDAPASALRHHKRVLSGNAPKADPVAAALAKSHFLTFDLAALRVRQLLQELAGLWDHVNLAAEDLGEDARVEGLASALYDLREKTETYQAQLHAARITMKDRLGRL